MELRGGESEKAHHHRQEASHSDTCHALAGGRERGKIENVYMASSVRTCGVHDGPACVVCVCVCVRELLL